MPKFTLTHFTTQSLQQLCYIFTVVMLGFWWCQFNTGILAWGLCLSSTVKGFVCLFQFNICVLGYGL